MASVQRNFNNKQFDNTSLMVAANLSVGEVVETRGYSQPADGGHGRYIIVSPGTGTADNGRFFNLANSNQAKLLDKNITPQQYGADANGVTDDTAAIQAAIDDGNYKLEGTYGVGSSLVLQTSTNGICENATIQALSDSFSVFVAPADHDFFLTGNLKVIGAGATGTGIGFDLFDAYAYKITGNIEVSNFNGFGVRCDGTTIATIGLNGFRGQQGFWSGLSIRNCASGLAVLRRAEYVQFVSPTISQCTTVGCLMEAGNCVVTGGNITDNQGGVDLISTGSTNHLHGTFEGTNINHNIDYNIRATDVTLGHTFNGCHVYGDSSLVGQIQLTRSAGINFTGGIIDANVVVDGNTAPTFDYNNISNNFFAGTLVDFNQVNDGLKKTIIRDNFTTQGFDFEFNDRGYVGVNADGSAGMQALPNNTTTILIFDNERYDNRLLYDPTTGIFTSDQDMHITVSQNTQFFLIGGTFVDGFVAVYVAGVARAIFPVVANNAANTSLNSTGALSLAITQATNVEIRANIETTAGTIDFIQDANSSLSIYTTY